MKICLKELREMWRWLRLAVRKDWSQGSEELRFTIIEFEELIRIFAASIRTATRNHKGKVLRASVKGTPPA
jgi:hypothetical protein